MQRFRIGGVDAPDHLRDAREPLAERLEDLRLALVAVRDVLADLRLAVGDPRAVRRIDRARRLREQALERAQVVEQVAALGGDHGGADAEHVVAREERPFLLEHEAEMVLGVAGRVHARAASRPACAAREPSPIGVSSQS